MLLIDSAELSRENTVGISISTNSVCETGCFLQPFPQNRSYSIYDVIGQESMPCFVLTFSDCEGECLFQPRS